MTQECAPENVATPHATNILGSELQWVSAGEQVETANSVYPQMYRILDDFGQLYRDHQQALADLATARHEPFWRLALSVGCHQQASPVREFQVGVYAALLADSLGWSPADCDALQQAAPLRDIGMASVSDQLAPMSRLFSNSELRLLQTHPTIGAEMLGDGLIPELRLASEVALSHHEQFDGKGYPAALSGKNIPMSARIVAAAEFFDGLTSEKGYRLPLSDAVVFDLVSAEAGIRFDPQVIEALLDLRGLLEHVRGSVAGMTITLAAPAPDRDMWQQLKLSYHAAQTAVKAYTHMVTGSYSWK